MINHFERRTHLYLEWDRRLQGQTRFYGAAALTNVVLAEVALRWRACVSRACLELLNAIGAALEENNIELAHRLRDGGPGGGADLDRTIVHHEQMRVESLLQQFQLTGAVPLEPITAELDRLILCGSMLRTLSQRRAGVALYAQVLRQVVADLGRSIRFTGQEDRVRIGYRLTEYLRGSKPAGVLADLLFS